MNLFLLSLIPFIIFTVYKTSKSFQMLQQNYYNDFNRYLFWVLKNSKKALLNIDILFLTLVITLFLSFKFNAAFMIILYLLIFMLYRDSRCKEQNKLPLKVTSRVKRLYITTFVMYAIIIGFMCILFNEENVWLYYLILGFITYLNYYIVILINYINKPIEKFVYLYYKRRAINKLNKMNVPVIGITGSYGKTSSKNIINDILDIKYNPLATPKSFNTPYGLIITINNYLDKFHDMLITEMGAFKRGEIKGMCKLVHPKYGILTTIGEAHLESFGSRENIQKGKFELIESLPSDGLAILNGDDQYQLSYKLKNKCKVLWTGIDNKDVDIFATNIKLTGMGTTFDVVFKGDKEKYLFSTKLLGKHNVYNILPGILLGRELGMSIQELQRGVTNIKPIEHRLELKKSGTITIIDDAYNSNPVGSHMATQVLGMMNGTKIIVTPGMIELGDEQYELNKKFGTYIAGVADYVILVGSVQTKPIYDGLMSEKYDKDKIFVLNDVKEAFPLMRRLASGETYVLLENDLPDLFNE